MMKILMLFFLCEMTRMKKERELEHEHAAAAVMDEESS